MLRRELRAARRGRGLARGRAWIDVGDVHASPSRDDPARLCVAPSSLPKRWMNSGASIVAGDGMVTHRDAGSSSRTKEPVFAHRFIGRSTCSDTTSTARPSTPSWPRRSHPTTSCCATRETASGISCGEAAMVEPLDRDAWWPQHPQRHRWRARRSQHLTAAARSRVSATSTSICSAAVRSSTCSLAVCSDRRRGPFRRLRGHAGRRTAGCSPLARNTTIASFGTDENSTRRTCYSSRRTYPSAFFVR